MPGGVCDVHGAGVRSYAKGIDQEEWPRASAAVDLSHVRPIQINAPTLLAQSDIYHSVNPVQQNGSRGGTGTGNDSEVKIARATSPDGKDPGVNGAAPPVPAAGPPTGEKEVRRAEAVGPMDFPTAAPVLTIPAPQPARF